MKPKSGDNLLFDEKYIFKEKKAKEDMGKLMLLWIGKPMKNL